MLASGYCRVCVQRSHKLLVFELIVNIQYNIVYFRIPINEKDVRSRPILFGIIICNLKN